MGYNEPMACNFSPDKFGYIVSPVVGGTEIVLINLETNEDRRFFLAGERNRSALRSHMDSLTDDLMGQWFNKREKKGKKSGA